MKIFSGSSNKPLAEKIAQAMEKGLSPIEIFVFPDGEKRIQIQESVVEEDCVVVQTTATPVAENYMELFFIVDGLKRSGARSVTVVVPYLGYQRQDHIFRDGEAVSLDVVIHALERTGASKVIAFDFHSIKIPEVFTVPVTQLSALPLFADEIKEKLGGDLSNTRDLEAILVSPDMGGLRRISKISEMLNNMPWVATIKDRDLNTGEIVINGIDPLSGAGDIDLTGKTVCMVDDMISSGGTMIKSAELLKKKGVKKVVVYATHAIFSEDAPEALEKSAIDRVFVTDSVFVPEEKYFSKLKILSIAEMVARELKEEVKS